MDWQICVCQRDGVRPKRSNSMSNQSYVSRWIAWNLSQICCGVRPSSSALVSVAVPYCGRTTGGQFGRAATSGVWRVRDRG
eukprot:361415-Chlamydomonas_euryale.AAC.1